MSTWIFDYSRIRNLLLGTALFALSGCATGTGVTMGSDGFGFLKAAPDKVAVAGKSVVIAGPRGYCVDSTATRDTETGAFVLLGSCASVSNSNRATAPANPGLLTASVSGISGTAIGGSTDRLEAFFVSDAGKAALARDGNAQSVQILDTRKKEDAFYIHARDTSQGVVPGLSQDYWRGLFDVNGRIVTVSVVGFSTAPMSESVGLATLDAFAARIRRENRKTQSAGLSENDQSGFFGRLLK